MRAMDIQAPTSTAVLRLFNDYAEDVQDSLKQKHLCIVNRKAVACNSYCGWSGLARSTLL
jgi:hypothetical protein